MILLSGQIESLTTRKDKTLKITIGSQELSPIECANIFMLNQSFCYIGLKQEPFQTNETELLDSLKTDFENIKTPAQRLRGILYRNFEQNPEGYNDFNSFYIAKMEKICEHYKGKLD
jgi:hypothetical protein